MERIKDLIKEKGYTQQDFADALEISRSALTQQLSGKPSYSTLSKMAEILRVPIWQLFISPEEVINGYSKDEKEELNAIIIYKENHYKASTIEELEGIVSKIKSIGK